MENPIEMRSGVATSEAAQAPTCREPAGWRSQFAHPRGLGGRLAGWLMARKNAAMNARCVAWLAPATGARVLEIGFGHGRTLAALAERSAFVAGVDPSAEMLRMASAVNRGALADGRVALALGVAEALPFPDAHFDAALAANNVQFWDLPRALAEVRRVLRPGGTLLLGIRLRAAREGRFASPGFDAAQVEALYAPLAAAGFAQREERATAGGREVLGLFATKPS